MSILVLFLNRSSAAAEMGAVISPLNLFFLHMFVSNQWYKYIFSLCTYTQSVHVYTQYTNTKPNIWQYLCPVLTDYFCWEVLVIVSLTDNFHQFGVKNVKILTHIIVNNISHPSYSHPDPVQNIWTRIIIWLTKNDNSLQHQIRKNINDIRYRMF